MQGCCVRTRNVGASQAEIESRWVDAEIMQMTVHEKFGRFLLVSFFFSSLQPDTPDLLLFMLVFL